MYGGKIAVKKYLLEVHMEVAGNYLIRIMCVISCCPAVAGYSLSNAGTKHLKLLNVIPIYVT
jgi:hypothetical protein